MEQYLELFLGLSITSLAVFLTYNILFILRFGIPRTLSETYYILNRKRKDLGYLFTGMMFIVGLYLLPAFIGLGETMSAWSRYLDPLALLTCASICFVGATPAFMWNLSRNVYPTASKIATGSALVWCLVATSGHNWLDVFIPIVASGLVSLAGIITKTWKEKMIYWLELICFGSTFATVILELIMQMI